MAAGGCSSRAVAIGLCCAGEVTMKKFLVLYRSSVSAADQMANATPEQAKAGMDAWMSWANRAGSAIVDLGSPVGASVAVGSGGGGRADGHVGGFSILQAESLEAVKSLLVGHPHLMMPGGSIEVHEFLQLPGM
jgi:hypothetical protein